jgi:uncharacterized protein (TIGR00156 family)
MHHNSFFALGKGAALARFIILSVLTLALASGAGVAYAKKDKQDFGPVTGGYTGPGPALVSVQKALSMPDGTWVSIKGNIKEYLGGKQYRIADSTGAADAKIGPKAWMGQDVSASDIVEFQGKVKKEWSHTRIDVSRIIKQ